MDYSDTEIFIAKLDQFGQIKTQFNFFSPATNDWVETSAKLGSNVYFVGAAWPNWQVSSFNVNSYQSGWLFKYFNVFDGNTISTSGVYPGVIAAFTSSGEKLWSKLLSDLIPNFVGSGVGEYLIANNDTSLFLLYSDNESSFLTRLDSNGNFI
jgi:hypothetical protein